MDRLTMWISDEEKAALKERAARYGTSQNYIARIALRRELGFSTVKPPYGEPVATAPEVPKTA